MNISYFHASKFGNGAQVARHFQESMAKHDVAVTVQHVSEVSPNRMPDADLYVFSSPGRMGRPIGVMRRFISRLNLPEGACYAILNTEMTPRPDRKTGVMPTAEEVAKHQRMIPMMVSTLESKGLVCAGTEKVCVMDMKGPLEEGWQGKVEDFADTLHRYLHHQTPSEIGRLRPV